MVADAPSATPLKSWNPWSSLVAVAGFARVPVLTLARKCFLPVMAALIVSTVFAILVF
ncbi:hypothetical protein [Mycolicibacterium phlei]|uniref:hypothetical protein n=1 Tax=Mycolicibacterium phlei TaxID=1771 RepID=UPI00178C2F46|nr:hypothetical protein [Mycolicibacterium phlei]